MRYALLFHHPPPTAIPEADRRSEAGFVLAALIARFGDFDLAEDAFQDATLAALEH